MRSLQDLHELVEEEIKKINFPTDPENLYSPIKYVLNIAIMRSCGQRSQWPNIFCSY